VFALFTLIFALAGARPPATPSVVGPRDTTSSRPAFVFHAARAVGYRCAFDSTRLHTCKARYSQTLDVGTHVLRVRALGRRGAQSRTVAVTVFVRAPLPALTLGTAIAVGDGAGVPAVAGGVAWVPLTSTGTLARVDLASATVTGQSPLGPPAPAGSGDLDSAIVADGVVFAASDAGGRIVRGEGGVPVDVAPRPGGLAAGGGAVWAFHFLQAIVTRIDVASGAKRTFDLPNASLTGIAYGAGSVWVLSNAPRRVVRIDPASGAVTQEISIAPPLPQRRSVIATWWLAYGDGALWATLPNYDALARIDAATGAVQYFRLAYGMPFGVTVGGGAAWVATSNAVVELDAASGAIRGASNVPAADRSGFVSIAYGDDSAWLTNFDRGTLVRVEGPR
jgi:streptogramin lyase